ncbi:MAG: RNA methyltransferase [Bacteroidales bacterium]|nr:RNA methyltransferase [Bacteroidales bacterium]
MKQLSLDQLGRMDPEEYRQAEKMPVVVVLDNIRSLHNIGSVFRTADAFRVTAVFLCGITACPPHREIHKTALGATESVRWKYFKTTEEAIHHLKAKGFQVLAVEQTDKSTPLHHTKQTSEHTALVFGNEVEGVGDAVLQLCDGAIEIPQAGTKHSLNVSVCAGIVIWYYFTKWEQGGNL